jgi:ankyrin repeat protein
MLIGTKTSSDRISLRLATAVVVLFLGGLMIGRECIDASMIARTQASIRLQAAAVEGRVDELSAIEDERSPHLARHDFEQALRLAALFGREPAMVHLLSRSVDPDAGDDGGTTALMLLIPRPDTLGLARDLIDAGADVNVTDRRGRTALMKAVAGGQTEMIRLLLDAGASVHLADANGETALSEAIRAGDATNLRLIEQAAAAEKAQTRAKSRRDERIGRGFARAAAAQRRPA